MNGCGSAKAAVFVGFSESVHWHHDPACGCSGQSAQHMVNAQSAHGQRAVSTLSAAGQQPVSILSARPHVHLQTRHRPGPQGGQAVLARFDERASDPMSSLSTRSANTLSCSHLRTCYRLDACVTHHGVRARLDSVAVHVAGGYGRVDVEDDVAAGGVVLEAGDDALWDRPRPVVTVRLAQFDERSGTSREQKDK